MIERHQQGLKNAARFAIQPNMWGFCGEDSSQEILRDFVAERGDNSKLVRETLHNHGFPHLNSFLETIATLSESDTYDEEVVMSYWLGSFLTEKVGVDTKDLLVEKYGEQISPDFAHELKRRLPDEIYLTHLSQVALIAAADYDEKERTNLINHCMIAFGKVVEVNLEKRLATVEREVLRPSDEGYRVAKARQEVKIDTDLTPTITVGNEVAVHLGYLASTLSNDESERLRYWTKKVAALI